MDKIIEMLRQDESARSMLTSSLYRCDRSELSPHADTLPEITEKDVTRCQGHVAGHIPLMRESAPEYYRQLTAVLDANQSCLCYVAENYDVFGRYGNQALKNELRKIHLCVGANLSETAVGTNAAALAAHSPGGVWVIGEDHYLDALKSYACYAFPMAGLYGRASIILLITRLENLTQQIVTLFRFIETTETVFSGGLVMQDVQMNDLYMKKQYSEEQTDHILLQINPNGRVTYANDVFYDMFHTDYTKTINLPLKDILPPLAFCLECLRDGRNIMKRRVNLGGREYLADCLPINKENKLLGGIITLYKEAGPKSGSGTAKYEFDDLLGVSENFVQLKRFAERVSATKSTVLIQGESGTGKELFAHAIHNASDRRNKPFISLNCAAIPKDLIGSELFGYVGGAFTGANRTGAKGKFELADGGTLFLDEIGEMPIEMQSVLLRVLEDSTVTRIGGSAAIPVNVRLITATNQNLQAYIQEGKFRLDLYYRLNVINLHVMPLRERKDDIPLMAEHFVKRFAKANKIHINGITSEAMGALISYSWPGNIRELRNTIERGVITADTGYVELRNLPAEISRLETPQAPLPEAAEEDPSAPLYIQYRRDQARKLMVQYNGNKSEVAKHMGIARSTLYRILKEDKS